jgi:hypothetical protein
VNTPPAKAGGFGLRLKAGWIGHPADPLILAFSRREKEDFF